MPVMLTMCILLIAAAKTVKVTREAQGRSGPGSYYELKIIIPAGKSLDLLEVKKSWYKVRYSGQEVWISENSIVTQSASGSRASEPSAMAPAPLKASSAAVSAAIKGFWTRYTRTDRSKLTELPVDGCEVSLEKYEAFEAERSRAVSRDELLDRWSLRDPRRPGRVPFVKEQSIGYSIASSVADAPLVKDGSAANYVNFVGRYLAEGTERSDIPFRFYLLDTDHVNAVSCPGGYIVLTRGLLEMISDEAELAALLAHEMAHVIAGHGMKEVIDDRIRIQADDAFAALDEELGNDPAEEEELIGITNRAISTAKAPKLDKYEFEADSMALRYLARSGYDLNGLPRLLAKMKEKHGDSIDIFDLSYRNHPDFEKRIQLTGEGIKEYRKYEGQAFAGYYRTNMAF
ncbi:MAG: M48 family metalloprotease [Candidatus Latescibacterota bacterium]